MWCLQFLPNHSRFFSTQVPAILLLHKHPKSAKCKNWCSPKSSRWVIRLERWQDRHDIMQYNQHEGHSLKHHTRSFCGAFLSTYKTTQFPMSLQLRILWLEQWSLSRTQSKFSSQGGGDFVSLTQIIYRLDAKYLQTKATTNTVDLCS